MTLFQPLRTSPLGKTPFAMMTLSNGRLARVTVWYSAVCLCFKPLLTQHSRITGTTCVRDTLGLQLGQRGTSYRSWLVARQPLQVKFLLVALLAASCIVVPSIVRAIGTVLFATKVCTVHVGHFLPFLVDFQWINMFEFKPQLANLAGCMAHSSTWGVIETVIVGRVFVALYFQCKLVCTWPVLTCRHAACAP